MKTTSGWRYSRTERQQFVDWVRSYDAGVLGRGLGYEENKIFEGVYWRTERCETREEDVENNQAHDIQTKDLKRETETCGL